MPSSSSTSAAERRVSQSLFEPMMTPTRVLRVSGPLLGLLIGEAANLLAVGQRPQGELLDRTALTAASDGRKTSARRWRAWQNRKDSARAPHAFRCWCCLRQIFRDLE